MSVQTTQSGEKVVGDGPNVFKADLRYGPRAGEIIEAIGFSLPSDVIYHADGSDNYARKYTLRGTPATGWYYEYIGTYDVDTHEYVEVSPHLAERAERIDATTYDLADYE